MEQRVDNHQTDGSDDCDCSSPYHLTHVNTDVTYESQIPKLFKMKLL